MNTHMVGAKSFYIAMNTHKAGAYISPSFLAMNTHKAGAYKS